MFEVLIIGGGVSGVSCALILGSALKKPFMADKKIGVIAHQKSSALQEAIFYNTYGIPAGTLGKDLLENSLKQLTTYYPEVAVIEDEKVLKIVKQPFGIEVFTNKNAYATKNIVVATGNSNMFAIEGLMNYVIPHKKTNPEKQRIQLINDDNKVTEGIYVVGTLAGCRSQLSIAAGSGAAVATDILTAINNGIPTQSHDSIKKEAF